MRRSLARTRAARGRVDSQLARATGAATSAQNLTLQLSAQQAAAQLTARSAALDDSVGRLRVTVAALEVALQPPAPPAPPVSSAGQGLGAQAVSIAEQYLGVPYRWGGADPASGFDCSGLTMYVYAQLGIRLPHYAASQWNELPHVPTMDLQPGDLVFFEPRWDGPGHVGIYAGGDSFVEAPHTGDVVKIASVSQEANELGYVGAARPAAGALDPFAAYG
jgi:cell wall-associated NlpC family hydrolase